MNVKLRTVAVVVCDLRMCMQEDNPGPKNSKGFKADVSSVI